MRAGDTIAATSPRPIIFEAAIMIRGFAYGLGTLFTVGVIHMLTEPAERIHLVALNETAVAVFAGLIIAAFIAFFVAMYLPRGRTWGRAWLGGLLGFFGPVVVVFTLLLATAGVSKLTARSPASPPPCSGVDCR